MTMDCDDHDHIPVRDLLERMARFDEIAALRKQASDHWKLSESWRHLYQSQKLYQGALKAAAAGMVFFGIAALLNAYATWFRGKAPDAHTSAACAFLVGVACFTFGSYQIGRCIQKGKVIDRLQAQLAKKK